MESRKLLSVVVPTKDRYKYLKYLIELIASFGSDDIEMVIQDNSDNNTEFLAYLDKLDYDFIRYSHIYGQIPMAINSDKAILNSTGEYVCFLGDDDGLTKYTLECVKWMKREGIEAVKSAEVRYYWPDVSDGTEEAPAATIRYYPFDGKVIYPNAYELLLKVLRAGIPDRGDMPLVYHSIVKREALDRVYKRVGTFFPGNSPDISNAVALSLTINKFAIVNLPLAFSGCSVFHGGGVHATGKKEQPKISDIPWFRPDSEQNWDKKLPRVASSSMIWADSAISALKQMGREDLYSEIDFYRLYSAFALSYPSLRQKAKDICDSRSKFELYYFLAIVRKYVYAINRRIGWALGWINKAEFLYNINNIREAVVALERIAKESVYFPF